MRHSFSASLTVLFLLLVLNGCATLSKDECRHADWRTIGFEDGSRGHSSQRIGQHREACAEYGVSPQFEQYMAGHKQGVRQYCVPGTGFSAGRSGSNYNNICPQDLEPSFLAAFNQGRKVREMDLEIQRLDREIHSLQHEQETLQKDIDKNEEMIVSDTTSRNLRRELLEQNRKLEELIAEKQTIIFHLERDIENLRRLIARESRY